MPTFAETWAGNSDLEQRHLGAAEESDIGEEGADARIDVERAGRGLKPSQIVSSGLVGRDQGPHEGQPNLAAMGVPGQQEVEPLAGSGWRQC